MRLQQSLTLLCLVLALLLLLFLACISRVGRRGRDDGGWGLSAKLFSIGERGLLAGSLIVCICLFRARLFSASDRRLLFKAWRHVDASGRRWRDTDGRGLPASLFSDGGETLAEGGCSLLVCTCLLSARLFSTSGFFCLVPLICTTNVSVPTRDHATRRSSHLSFYVSSTLPHRRVQEA